MMTRVAIAMSCAPLVAWGDTRPAPDYFVDVTFATTTAQALAQACPSLSFELLKASRASNEVMLQLVEDGFDLDTLAEDIDDPAPRFAEMRAEFLAKHALTNGAATELVCHAGHAEREAETLIGQYLTDVSG